jgi:hypothetical protein
MQLTTARLKQIIKEELETVMSQMADTEVTADETETTVDPLETEIASLEQQLAEAKAKKAAGAAGKAMKKPLGAAKHPDHKMQKMGAAKAKK